MSALRSDLAQAGSRATRTDEVAAKLTAAGSGVAMRALAALEACGWSVDQASSDGRDVLRAGSATLTLFRDETEGIYVAHDRMLAMRRTTTEGADDWSACCSGEQLRLVPPRGLSQGPEAAVTVDLSVLPHADPTDALIVATLIDPLSHDAAREGVRRVDGLVLDSQRRLAAILEGEARRYRSTIGEIAATLGVEEQGSAARLVGRFSLALLAHLVVKARTQHAVAPMLGPELPTTWNMALQQLHDACASQPDDEGRVPAAQGLLDPSELERCAELPVDDTIFNRILELTLRTTSENGSRPRPPVDLANVTPFEIGSLHESLLEILVPEADPTVDGEEEQDSERSAGGVFYTPLALVDEVLRHALDPVLEERVGRGTDSNSEVLALTVCDPACGSGNFLLPVARRMAVAALATEQPMTLLTYRMTLTRVVESCIYGADRDDFAIRLARFGLRLLCDPTGRETPLLGDRFAVGDSLIGAWPHDLADVPEEALDRVATVFPESVRRWRQAAMARAEGQGSLFDEPEDATHPLPYSSMSADAWCDLWFKPVDLSADPLERFAQAQNGQPSPRPSQQRTYLHWSLAFPSLGEGPALFDVVVGNPPYLRGRDHAQIDPEGRHFISARFPACQGGSWNLFVPFVILAARLARERSGLLVQSSVLGSQYAAALHEHLLAEGGVAACLDFSEVPDLFPSAAVQVASLVVTPDATRDTRFVRYADGLKVESEVLVGPQGLRALPLGYWTLPTSGLAPEETALFLEPELRLGDVATIQDGMEQAAAYEVRKLVRESSGAPGELRLTPTGLIDPFVNLWGSKPVKYLGIRLQRPVLDTEALQDGGFTRMAEQGGSEKIAIAGLSTRIEAVVDEGTALVSKSAFAVQLHDDAICPYATSAVLNSALANRIYNAAFGANGFGAGSRNYRPPTLGRLPLPDRGVMIRHTEGEPDTTSRLSEIGQRLHQARREGEDIRELLTEAERAVESAFGLNP